MTAAVGEPLGRNAYWSVNDKVGGGDRNVGYRKCVTTILSMIRVRTGVMEIGRKSECPVGDGTFGIGLIHACFH